MLQTFWKNEQVDVQNASDENLQMLLETASIDLPNATSLSDSISKWARQQSAKSKARPGSIEVVIESKPQEPQLLTEADRAAEGPSEEPGKETLSKGSDCEREPGESAVVQLKGSFNKGVV